MLPSRFSGQFALSYLCHMTLVCMVALVLSWGGAARAQTVGILLSDHGGHYSEYLETLSRSLGEQSSRFRLVTLPPGREKPDEATLAKLHLIVAVGVQAMRTAAEWGNAPPVLNVLVPRASHDKLLFESIPLQIERAHV